jgi:hypothetical protein
MLSIELRPVPNNKDIFNVEYINRCKITFEPSKYKGDIAQCTNYRRSEHTKNYCHLTPSCVKCTGDHLTNQCHRKERSSDVLCVFCDRIHPEILQRCTACKDLQKKNISPIRLKQYAPAQIKQALYTQQGVTSAQETKKMLTLPQIYSKSHT